MTTDPNAIRSDIERTRVELGQDVDALADKVNPGKAVHRQTEKVKGVFRRAKDRVMGSAHDMADGTGDALHSAGEAVGAAPQRVASATRGNPIAAGLIVLGAAWLVSSLIPASRPERDIAEKAKDAAAPLVDEVKNVAQDAAQNLKYDAKDAAGAVKDSAAEGVENVKSEGKEAAADVKDAAQQGGSSTGTTTPTGTQYTTY
ncbi:type IV secretory pathway TrbL component [Agromyces flavus]|uniref:Type IV secretory pathway TrbL component n=1 Tax=Agromyces flavus TaxID=589382 RepID=A0A1H1X8P3_9MICO|nr:DUF3618 domain-containing protein [Agromyces flavus]MCP2366354.1 type IV secretory pathway TrbL component [Agromyces flavus]GGI44508.1 hypothetical protein GCM10010932_04960 [Agromyces flavus]SDT05460.1 Protein of unknown function [Agromyces flavus]